MPHSTAAHAGHVWFAAYFVFFLLVSIGLYFAPLAVAIVRRKANVVAIGALNFFLGWSLIGWVISLVWALRKDLPLSIIVASGAPGRPNDWR